MLHLNAVKFRVELAHYLNVVKIASDCVRAED